MQFRLFIAAMFFIVLYTFDWNSSFYDRIQQNVFDHWYEEEFLPSSFQDTIHAKADFSTYYIKRVRFISEHLHPEAVLKLDYNTYDFVAVGDVLVKKAGSNRVTVIKQNKKKQSFDIQFCKLKFFKERLPNS